MDRDSNQDGGAGYRYPFILLSFYRSKKLSCVFPFTEAGLGTGLTAGLLNLDW